MPTLKKHILHLIPMEVHWDNLEADMDKTESFSLPALGFVQFLFSFVIYGVCTPGGAGRGFLLHWGLSRGANPTGINQSLALAPSEAKSWKASARVEKRNNKQERRGRAGMWNDESYRAVEGWSKALAEPETEVKKLWITVTKTLLTFLKLGLSTCDGFWSGKVEEQIIAKASKIVLDSPKDEGGFVHVETWRDP